MSEEILRESPLKDFRRDEYSTGTSLVSQYPRLKAILETDFPNAPASLAEPVENVGKGFVFWKAPRPGEVRTLGSYASLSAEHRAAAGVSLQNLAKTYDYLGRKLLGETRKVPDPVPFGHLFLRLAASVSRVMAGQPSDVEVLFVGNDPVVFGWGLSPANVPANTLAPLAAGAAGATGAAGAAGAAGVPLPGESAVPAVSEPPVRRSAGMTFLMAAGVALLTFALLAFSGFYFIPGFHSPDGGATDENAGLDLGAMALEEQRLKDMRDNLRLRYLTNLSRCDFRAPADDPAPVDPVEPVLSARPASLPTSLTERETANLSEEREPDKFRVAIPDPEPETPKPVAPEKPPAPVRTPAPAQRQAQAPPPKPAPAPVPSDAPPAPAPIPPSDPSEKAPSRQPSLPPGAFPLSGR